MPFPALSGAELKILDGTRKNSFIIQLRGLWFKFASKLAWLIYLAMEKLTLFKTRRIDDLIYF
jgi:hypothetical protein